MAVWFPIPIAVLLLLFASCGWDDQEEEVVESATAPKLVGRVASVNEGRGFVLIEGYGEWRIGEGLILSSIGEGRTANLVASGERMGRFAAADIQGGEVRAGDQVFGRPLKEQGDEKTLMPLQGAVSGGEAAAGGTSPSN